MELLQITSNIMSMKILMLHPEERRKKYHELELMYKPDLDYDNDFYNSGAFWFAQGHVFWAPFYYIDYNFGSSMCFPILE